jgi:hypothetical protein
VLALDVLARETEELLVVCPLQMVAAGAGENRAGEASWNVTRRPWALLSGLRSGRLIRSAHGVNSVQ